MLLDFVKRLADRSSDGLIVTGDIAESRTIYQFLEILSGAYRRPIYFVLGNHDYYGDWMHETHEKVRRICQEVPPGILNWMPDKGFIRLNKKTAILGHDGFYDGQEGQPGMAFSLTDFYMPSGIRDLAQAMSRGSSHLFAKLLELGTNSAVYIRSQVERAHRQGIRRFIIITHVPPFLEASRFRGKPSDPAAAPFYVNKVLGEALLELAEEFPKCSFEVFAGHTHGNCTYEARKNLVVRVGNARYEHLPQFQTPIEY